MRQTPTATVNAPALRALINSHEAWSEICWSQEEPAPAPWVALLSAIDSFMALLEPEFESEGETREASTGCVECGKGYASIEGLCRQCYYWDRPHSAEFLRAFDDRCMLCGKPDGAEVHLELRGLAEIILEQPAEAAIEAEYDPPAGSNAMRIAESVMAHVRANVPRSVQAEADVDMRQAEEHAATVLVDLNPYEPPAPLSPPAPAEPGEDGRVACPWGCGRQLKPASIDNHWCGERREALSNGGPDDPVPADEGVVDGDLPERDLQPVHGDGEPRRGADLGGDAPEPAPAPGAPVARAEDDAPSAAQEPANVPAVAGDAETLVLCPYCQRGYPDLRDHFDEPCAKREAHRGKVLDEPILCSWCDQPAEYMRTHQAICAKRPPDGPNCVHIWQLSSPEGEVVHQKCRRCGVAKDVPSDPTGGSNGLSSRQRTAKGRWQCGCGYETAGGPAINAHKRSCAVYHAAEREMVARAERAGVAS